MSARALAQNVLYTAYARVHGMTVPQRWEADNKYTGPFDTWVAALKDQFRLQHPGAIDSAGNITDLTTWFLFLRNLRPDTMRQREFL